ncbi:RES domain-containing protein [bacterium]|nr:MAG: RES domain-containing protein [bacterium]
MPLSDHELRAVLTTASPASFSGIVTRFTHHVYRRTLASPAGAEKRGGRYNSPGTPALYSSFRRETALREFTQYYSDADPISLALMGSLAVSLGRVVDLTDAVLISRLGFTRKQLTAISIPGIPQPAARLGDTASSIGIDGLVVWSAVDPDQQNLVIFPQNATGANPVLLVTEMKRRA